MTQTLAVIRQRPQESALVVQLRVLGALVLREMSTRFGRTSLGYFWAVAGPAGGLAMMVLVFSAVSRRPSVGDSFALFFATGLLSFDYFSDISRALSNAVRANRALLSFPRVTILDTLIARLILEFVTVTFVFCVIMTTVLLTVEDQVAIDLAGVALAIALASFLGVAMGVLNCMLFTYSPFWERVYPILTRPLLIVSGVFFTFEEMPAPIRDILWWNPLIHVTALMRRAFYPTYEADFVSVGFVIATGLGPLFVGLMLIRILRPMLLEE